MRQSSFKEAALLDPNRNNLRRFLGRN